MKLRATQYLPDIIQLQKILYDKYNYNFDEEEVSKQTVKDLQQNTGSQFMYPFLVVSIILVFTKLCI